MYACVYDVYACESMCNAMCVVTKGFQLHIYHSHITHKCQIVSNYCEKEKLCFPSLARSLICGIKEIFIS